MQKNFHTLKGTVTEMTELIHIIRPRGKDFFKRMLTIETLDSQRLFAEIRNTKLRYIETENIQVNSLVEIEYSFEGSEKSGKKYNNIYIHSIKKV